MIPLIRILLVLVCCMAPLTASGQELASSKTDGISFDVVSVRPSPSPSTPFGIRPLPEDFSVTGSSLNFLIQ